MNKRFLTLVGVAAVLSVGTYAGLNIIKPHTTEEVKVAETIPADKVFGASVSNPEEEGTAAATTDGAAAAPAETAAAPAAAPADAAAPAADAAAPAADSTSTAVAPPAAGDATTAAAATPAETAAPAAEAPKAATAAATETAAAEPVPAAVEPAAPAPEPAAKPAKTKVKKSAPAKQAVAKSGTTGNKAWWPKENPNKLSLVYAGPASFKPAIVLMFNGAFFNDGGLKSNLKVTDSAGKAVSGNWEIGENNRRMLVFAVPGVGSYKVSVGAGLTDNKGRKLGTHLSGPVQVR